MSSKRWHSAAQNFVISQGIAIEPYAAAGVPLKGVDNAILDLFDDPHMICVAVLRLGRTAWQSQPKEILMPGRGSAELSIHWPLSLSPWTPRIQLVFSSHSTKDVLPC